MKYISLITWTDQGIQAAKDSPKRLDQAREMGQGFGVKIEEAFMTMGDVDMVCIVDAPDDESYARFGLRLCQNGAVRTRTLKAFSEDEYRRIMNGL
ncbi:GYD family protein [Alsobacter soli]|uniref:GYD family protein n=1 Tax=Alsobacter soli TaxID=2109933 RepID=A0A2T1HYF9_9HYPH|nr:GYD domain-containing protein [Alsobacter soli]PSC06620.1 GYD family protein [Alsobacter soli]